MIDRITIAGVALMMFLGCTNEFPDELLPGNGGGCDGLVECQPSRSCCETRPIPGGTFSRGYDRSGSPNQPGLGAVNGWQTAGAALATVSAFEMDAFEVNVGRMRRFVEGYDSFRLSAGDGAHPAQPASGWQDIWSSSLPPNRAVLQAQLESCEGSTWEGDERRPMNCVDWFVAFAFCAWDGGRLPTEAEWNFVAAGGSEQRAFPWSEPPEDVSAPDARHAVGLWSGLDIQSVGSRAPADIGRFGVSDLAGNVREWVMDYVTLDDSYPLPCSDCINLEPSGERARRGGDWESDALRARTAYRSGQAPTNSLKYNGIRCVRD